jgi:hypothetical protein
MKKHLEKIKTCDRTFDSYKYKDDELYYLSLTRIYNINKNSVCEICNKEFKNIFTLKRHQSIFHKSDNECEIEDNIKDSNINDSNINDIKTCNIINESINNGNNNIINNNNIITNNNISINVINFDDNWNTSHIDNKQKILLFLKKYKFTSTLENILENEVNLNVLIDKTSENGIVQNNNKFEKMNIKDIVKKTMKKLMDSLNNFKNDIYQKNEHEVDLCIIDDEMNKANIKYENYKKNKIAQDDVNDLIKNIYNKNKDNVYKICKSSGY